MWCLISQRYVVPKMKSGFVRKKKINNREYAYFVKNTRIGNKTKQEVIQYLGRADKIVEVLSR